MHSLESLGPSLWPHTTNVLREQGSAVYVEMESTKEFLSTLNENVKHTQVMSHD